MRTDHYQALGLSAQATPAEIRAAYLRLMREHHPDHRPGDPSAAARAREVNAAYEVLGDGPRRAAYDRLRTNRAAATGQRPTHVVHRAGDVGIIRVRPTAQNAYGRDRGEFRAAFSAACLKVGLATVALGAVLLLGLS